MKSRLLLSGVVSLAIFRTDVEAQSAGATMELDSGIVYETTTRTSLERMPSAGSMVRTRTIETPRGMKVEVLERTAPRGLDVSENLFSRNAGSYTLTLYDSLSTFQVDTVKREYFKVDMSEFTDKSSSLSKMMAEVKASVSETGFNAEDLGDGELVLGHETRHWKIHQELTTSTTVNGDTTLLISDSFSDSFYAKDVWHPKPRLTSGRPTTPGLDSAKAFVKGLVSDRMLKAHAALPTTLRLKVIEKRTTKVDEVEVIAMTTHDITSLARGRFDESLFQVPKGYKKVNPPFVSLPNDSSVR